MFRVYIIRILRGERMSDELKPCSFCGEAELVCYQGNKAIGTPNALYWYKIVCMKCFCQTGERSERLTDVRKLLAEDWNTRPIEDELRARVKELEEHNTMLEQALHEIEG